MAAIVATIGVVPAGLAAAAPVLTIDPAADLVDGQRLTVTGSGFTAGEFLLLAQCASDVTSVTSDGCLFGFGDVDGSGGLQGQILVRTLLAGDGDDVDCRTPDACVLVAAAYDDAVDDYREVARTALLFDPDAPIAPPPTMSVSPSEGLVDGQTVDVSGSGALSDNVELVQCTADPADWRDCDQETSQFPSTSDGAFAAEHRVSAVISTDASGQVDCRTAGPCVLAAIGDPGRWGDTTTVPLAFDPDGPLLPPPTVTITPAEGLVDGQTVQIVGEGFRVSPEGAIVWLAQCAPDPAEDRCRISFDRFIWLDEEGGFTATMPVTARVPTPEGLHDCRTGVTGPERCSIVATTTADVTSPRRAQAELLFDPDAPLLPDPEIEVAPASGLGDFTEVAVSGRQFTPESRVDVQVCRTGASGEECDWTNGEMPTADADGNISTDIAVFAGATGPGEPGSPARDCRQAPGCEIVATDDARGLSARQPLEFGPPDEPRGRYLDPVFPDVEVTRDVVYRRTTDYAGNPIDLALDIYRPAGDTATVRPAIVWMYGGWFAFGDKRDQYIVDFATESARRGYVGIAINYRERPNTVSDPAQLVAALLDAYDDAIGAVEWVQDNADDYGIDPEAIAASGWSAGAVTSLNLAYMPGERGPATSPIAAALPVAGVMLPRIDPGEPPSLVFFATHDSTLPPGTNNTDTLCPRTEELGIACELVTYDGADHGIINRSDDIMRRGTDFLVDQVLDPGGYFDVAADAGGTGGAASYEVDEGSAVALDGSGSTGAGLSYAWSPAARVDAPTSSTPTLRGLDDGTETLTLDVTNHHGITAGATAEVVTRNVAPAISDAAVSTTSGSRTVALSATITDPGAADTHTATIDWGDGRSDSVLVSDATFRASHDYATAGRYPIELTVTDDDAGSTTWTSTVSTGCTIRGTDRADVLLGTRRADVICGLGGHDVIYGAAGDDVLLGGSGNDLLIGGPGDDTLDGEAGTDLLVGGPGDDTCTGELHLSCRETTPGPGPTSRTFTPQPPQPLPPSRRLPG